jgi:hypothetical protein
MRGVSWHRLFGGAPLEHRLHRPVVDVQERKGSISCAAGSGSGFSVNWGEVCQVAKKDVTVGPTEDDRWSVKRKGNDRASSIHDTQREAINVGKRYAQEEGSDLIIKGEEGKIRSKDSYGNDPNPPKDMEH